MGNLFFKGKRAIRPAANDKNDQFLSAAEKTAGILIV